MSNPEMKNYSDKLLPFEDLNNFFQFLFIVFCLGFRKLKSKSLRNNNNLSWITSGLPFFLDNCVCFQMKWKKKPNLVYQCNENKYLNLMNTLEKFSSGIQYI